MEQKIDDFIAKKLSEAETAAIKQKMIEDPEFALQVRSRKLEQLVQRGLKRERTKDFLKSLELQEQKRISRRRRLTYISAAAAVLVGFFVVVLTQFTADNSGGMTAINLTKDYNTKSVKQTEAMFKAEDIIGVWQAEIKEKNGVSVILRLETKETERFTLQTYIFFNGQRRQEEELTASGIYKVSDEKLSLDLEPTSISTPTKSNPFATGILELWVKENRLFRTANTIVLLNDSSLILRFNQSQGLEMQKQ